GVHPKTQSGEAGHTNGRSVDVHSQNPRTSENEDHHRCPTRSSAYATGSPPMTPPPHRWPTCSVTGMTPTPCPSPKSPPHSPPPPCPTVNSPNVPAPWPPARPTSASAPKTEWPPSCPKAST